MERFQCSFSEYLKLLKETKVKTELSEIFEKIQQFSPVRETQRSILTTWSISVNRLSSKAFAVLRSMSMLGPGRIPEALVKLYSCESNNRAIAGNTFNIGTLLQKLGSFDEAEEKLLLALEMWEKIVGRNVCHPEVARVVNSLGSLYVSQDKISAAIVMCSLSLGMKRQLLGENTNLADVAHALSNLGSLFEKEGRWSEAELVCKELLKMSRKMYGCISKHRSIAKSLRDLGRAYWMQNKLGEAESTLVECLKMFREMHANDAVHFLMALRLMILSDLYMRQEN